MCSTLHDGSGLEPRGDYIADKRGLRPAWADEALDDPDAVELNPDPSSKSGRSARTIGWSASAQQLLTVITVVDEGTLYGVNCWRSNPRDQRIYREANE